MGEDATTGDVAGSSSFDLFGLFDKASATVQKAATTVMDFQVARDQLAQTRSDAAFNSYLKQTELDLKRQQVAVNADMQRIQAQTVLEKARAQLAAAIPSSVSNNWVLWLTVISTGIAVLAYMKGRS